MITDTCPHAVVRKGYDEPCDRPATGGVRVYEFEGEEYTEATCERHAQRVPALGCDRQVRPVASPAGLVPAGGGDGLMTLAIIVTAAVGLTFFVGLNAFMGWISGATVKETVIVGLAILAFTGFVVAVAFGLSAMWAGVE